MTLQEILENELPGGPGLQKMILSSLPGFLF